MSEAPKVYAAIQAVMDELSQEGVAKTGRNKEQGYNFRGIDAVHAALCRKLVKNGLLMLPRALSHRHEVRVTKSGSNQYVAVMEIAFDLVAVADGSLHTVVMWGEAQDSGDKSTNKAMSAAYKYAAIQAFSIPIEPSPDDDADNHTPEDTYRADSDALKFAKSQIASKKTDAEVTEYWVAQKDGLKDLLSDDEYKAAYMAVSARKNELKAKTENPFGGE